MSKKWKEPVKVEEEGRLRGPGSSAAAASHLASGLVPDTSDTTPTLLLRPALEEADAKTG